MVQGLLLGVRLRLRLRFQVISTGTLGFWWVWPEADDVP